MISIEARLFDKVLIKDFLSQGHALKKRFGFRKQHDTLCSAVSALEYTFLYSIETMLALEKETEIKNGFFRLRFKELDRLTVEQRNIFEVLSRSLLIGLGAIRDQHKEAVRLVLIQTVP